MKSNEIQIWQHRISKAEEYLNRQKLERNTAIKLYTGTYFGDLYKATSDFSEVNFVYEYVDVLISSIYARDPFIFVKATTGRRAAFAETMQTALNYYWRELKIKKKMHSCLIDAVLQPPGWINLGYMFYKSKINKEIEESFPELKDTKPVPTESEMGIYDESRKVDDIFCEQVSSWNVMFPEGYHNIRECPYLIVKQKISLEDLYINPMFNNNKFKINSSNAYGSGKLPQKYDMKASVNIFGGTTNQITDYESLFTDLFHVFDRRGMQMFTVARNFMDATLFEKKWEIMSEGFSLFPLFFNEVPSTDEKCNAYPMSDIVPMFPQLKELSLISSAMLRHRNRAGTLLLGKKGIIKETDAANIQKASDVDFILLPDISESVVRGFTPPALPQDFYRLRDMLLQDLLRVSGYAQLLGQSQGIDTATESENVKQGAMLRQSRKVDTIEDFIQDIAVYLSGLIWQFKTKEEIAEIIGEDVDEEMWPTLPEDFNEARRIIQKEISFRIEAGSTRPPKDEAVERKQWMDLSAMIKASFPNRIKDDAYLKQILKKFDFKDLENVIIGHDEEETVVAQEENKLLLQNVVQIVSPNENHMLHLQIHAQAYQVPGLKLTDAMDKHIDDHAKFMEMKNPKAVPQRGDVKPPMQSTTPEASRGGVTAFSDILGSLGQPQPGVEAGK